VSEVSRTIHNREVVHGQDRPGPDEPLEAAARAKPHHAAGSPSTYATTPGAGSAAAAARHAFFRSSTLDCAYADEDIRQYWQQHAPPPPPQIATSASSIRAEAAGRTVTSLTVQRGSHSAAYAASSSS